MASGNKSLYDVLELKEDAKLIDVKKAYRRLALKYHPDRNNGSVESTERFKEISEAYGVLSDSLSRRDYDSVLKSQSFSPVAATASPRSAATGSTTAAVHPSRFSPKRKKDPFKQFDELFQNDPFFNDAFEDIDGEFSKRFTDDADGTTSVESSGSMFMCGVLPKKPAKNTSWGQWAMKKLGIEVSVTSYSHEKDGTVVAKSYTSKPSGTSTNKTTRTYVENGRQVTIMSMEKDGNKIEDKFIGGKLVERKVNGNSESVAQVTAS